jgi:hypothetical protein
MAFRNNRSGVCHSRRPWRPVLPKFSGSCRSYAGCSLSVPQAEQRSLWLCAGSGRPGGLNFEVERLYMTRSGLGEAQTKTVSIYCTRCRFGFPNLIDVSIVSSSLVFRG